MSAPLQPEGEDEVQGVKRILKRYKFCEVCSGGAVKSEGWAHRSRTQHAMRALTNDERAQVVQQWLADRREGEAARSRRFDENRKAQLAQEAEARPPAVAHPPQQPAWTLNFGKHKKQTLDKVLRVDPDYIPWAVASDLPVNGVVMPVNGVVNFCIKGLYLDNPGHGLVVGDINAPRPFIVACRSFVHFDPVLPFYGDVV